MQAQIRVERAYEVRVLLAVGERAEDPIGELADIALRSAEHELVGAEVLEHRDDAIAAQRTAENDRLLSLQQREMRAGRAALRTADARRETLVASRARETRAQRVRMSPRVDRSRELPQRRDDTGARPHHARVGDDLGDRHPEAHRRSRVP